MSYPKWLSLFVVNIVYFVVHIVCDCEVDVIANSLVLYLPFCSTLYKKKSSLSLRGTALPQVTLRQQNRQ